MIEMNTLVVDELIKIGTTITIIPLNVDGKIDALMITYGGIEYRVVYWFNGDRRETWLAKWEIKPKDA